MILLVGDTDLDIATGKEGDVEARCFRGLHLYIYYYHTNVYVAHRARFSTRPTGSYPLSALCLWTIARRWNQESNGACELLDKLLADA